MGRLSTMNEVKTPNEALSERWDRLVYADTEEYRTCSWEYLGVPYIVVYHVQSGRYRIFLEGRYSRLDMTLTLCDQAIASLQRYIESHRNVCDEAW